MVFKKDRKPRRKRKASSTASKALKEVRQLKKFVNTTIENKHTEIVTTNNNISTSSSYYYGFAGKCVQGTAGDSDQNSGALLSRIGNSITMCKEKLNFVFSPPATGTITENYNRIRLIVVEALEGNQNLVLSDILRYHNYALHGDMVFGSPYTTKTGTNSRYKIHMDKTFTMVYNGGNPTKIIKKTINHGKIGRVINFNDNSSTPTDYSLSVMLVSDSASAAHPIWNMSYRGTYKDA